MSLEFRVIGPPGCGKTTKLSALCQQAASEFGGDSVFVCSLTKAAAREVANKKINGMPIPVPRENIGTLHALCFRALGTPKIAETKDGMAQWNDWVSREQPDLALSGSEADVDDSACEAPSMGGSLGDKMLAQYQICRARLTPLEEMPTQVAAFAVQWEAWKKDSGLCDFTDMIDRCYLEGVNPFGQNMKVLLLDEAQDTPKNGMRLVRQCGQSAEKFTVVGDPLQNLYHWAGTDPEAFTMPALPQEQQEVLSQSYRVPRAVHARALQWIAPLKRRVEEQMGVEILYYPTPEEGRVSRSNATHRYPEQALREAEKHVAAGKEVMFIASCSHMLAPSIRVAREMGLPFHNPWREKRGDWNPLTPDTKGTTSSDRLMSFLRPNPDAHGEKCRMWTHRDLWQWVQIMDVGKFLQRGAKVRLEEIAKKEPLGGWQELEMEELLSFFKDSESLWAALTYDDDAHLAWFLNHVSKTRKAAMEFPVNVVKKRGAAALRKRPQVVFGTIHSLKGSEADVVYVFPDLSKAGDEQWRKPGPNKDAIYRAFYVAMTRAKEELVLCQQSSPFSVRF